MTIAPKLHMYTWRGREWFAIAAAGDVTEARKLLFEEEGGGDATTPVRQEAVKAIQETMPTMYFGPNAEFVVTDSGELRQADLYNEALRKRITEMESQLTTLREGCEMAAEIARADAAKLAELEEGIAESDDLRERLAKILSDTANALHGGPLPNGFWSWHDLAELATSQRKALAAAMQALRSYQFGNGAKDLAKETADHCEALLLETSRSAFQKELAAHGIDPRMVEEEEPNG